MKKIRKQKFISLLFTSLIGIVIFCIFFVSFKIQSKAALDFSMVGSPFSFNYSVTTPYSSSGIFDYPHYSVRNEPLLDTYGATSSSFFSCTQPLHIPGTVYNGFSLSSISTAEPRPYRCESKRFLTFNVEVILTLYSESFQPYFGSSSAFSDRPHLEIYLSDDRSQFIDFTPQWIPYNSLSSDQSILEFSCLLGAYVDPGDYNIFGWKLFLPCNLVCTGPLSDVYLDYSVIIDNPPGLDFSPYTPPAQLPDIDTSDEEEIFSDSLDSLDELDYDFKNLLQDRRFENGLLAFRSLITSAYENIPIFKHFIILSLVLGSFALILNGVLAYVRKSD